MSKAPPRYVFSDEFGAWIPASPRRDAQLLTLLVHGKASVVPITVDGEPTGAGMWHIFTGPDKLVPARPAARRRASN